MGELGYRRRKQFRELWSDCPLACHIALPNRGRAVGAIVVGRHAAMRAQFDRPLYKRPRAQPVHQFCLGSATVLPSKGALKPFTDRSAAICARYSVMMVPRVIRWIS